MKFKSIKKWLMSIFNPRYQLTLSDIKRSGSSYKTIYILKQYGTHEFIQLSFNDIITNDNIIQAINPKNLMEINLNEFLLKEESDKYKITEEIRNNLYKLKNRSEETIYSGEYIYKNIEMFQKINYIDLCKILYNTGFEKGRKLSTTIKSSNIQINNNIQYKDDNVIIFNKHININ